MANVKKYEIKMTLMPSKTQRTKEELDDKLKKISQIIRDEFKNKYWELVVKGELEGHPIVEQLFILGSYHKMIGKEFDIEAEAIRLWEEHNKETKEMISKFNELKPPKI